MIEPLGGGAWVALTSMFLVEHANKEQGDHIRSRPNLRVGTLEVKHQISGSGAAFLTALAMQSELLSDLWISQSVKQGTLAECKLPPWIHLLGFTGPGRIKELTSALSSM